FQILIEFVGCFVDCARVAVIAGNEQTGLRRPHEARRIASVAPHDRFALRAILHNELADQLRIERQRVTQQILPDAKLEPDDLAGCRRKRCWLDPHIVGEKRSAGEHGNRSNTRYVEHEFSPRSKTGGAALPLIYGWRYGKGTTGSVGVLVPPCPCRSPW